LAIAKFLVITAALVVLMYCYCYQYNYSEFYMSVVKCNYLSCRLVILNLPADRGAV